MDAVWARLADLIDRSPSVVDLLDHRLGSIAARNLRAAGRPVPAPLLEEERYASFATLAAPVVLRRVVEAHDGAVMLLKGPEVARRYPDPTMRPSHDLDVLVEDSAAAFANLRRAGCEVVRDDPSPQHELPLAFGDLPLSIELHSAPKWPDWAGPAPTRELFEAAVPAGEGLLAPRLEHHAVLLAVHSWAHRPLARLLDLVDVLVLLDGCDAAEAAATARRWGVGRVWDVTLRAADAVLASGPTPWTLYTWARNTPRVRRPTRGEELLERCLSPFAALPLRDAARVSGASLLEMLNARRSGRHSLGELRPEHPAILVARERGDAS